ncbi:MAG: endonuclease/exonuclease/phosphatase family protein [Prevotella sp.]|jgi:hypothetical protein
MKTRLFFLTALLAVFLTVSAQEKKYSAYAVGFYNLENLFDTQHDEGKLDDEFLPTGSYKWDSIKYTNKLHNMAQALSDMGTDKLPGVGCALIGVSEVENAHALSDLCAQPAMAARGYKFAHIEGPDLRGVDCALIYNPKFFEVEDMKLYPYVQRMKDNPHFVTRGFFAVTGKLANERITVIVCHLPSRFQGPAYREQGASEVKELKDSILKADPERKIFVMGDMNDDPVDKSMYKCLSAKESPEKVGDDDMYNPWYNILKGGKGTLFYKGSWNLFDQIVLSPNLVNRDSKRDFSTLKFWKNEVQRMPYLFQTEGAYKGSPKRTTAGGVWLNGYSDHLPVVVYLLKEQK